MAASASCGESQARPSRDASREDFYPQPPIKTAALEPDPITANNTQTCA